MEDAWEVGRKPGGPPSLLGNIKIWLFIAVPSDFVIHMSGTAEGCDAVCLPVLCVCVCRQSDGWIMSVFR